MRRFLLALTVAFLMSAVPAEANIYYVSQSTGSDSRTPTQAENSETPWKTVAHAAATVTVVPSLISIKPGTYAEDVTISKGGTTSNPISYVGTSTGVYIHKLTVTASHIVVYRVQTCLLEEPGLTGEEFAEITPFCTGVGGADGWPEVYSDVSPVSNVVRLNSETAAGEVAEYTAHGVKVISDFVSTPGKGPITEAERNNYVKEVDAQVEAHPEIYAIEVLNEPWEKANYGSEASNEAHQIGYARLVEAVHTGLVETAAKDGHVKPLELAAMWGAGFRNGGVFDEWWKHLEAGANADVDGVTAHPYSNPSTAAPSEVERKKEGETPQGEDQVVEVHKLSGKPVYITEVGWNISELASGKTGEEEQANNLTSVLGWARGLGYVPAVTVFQYRDGSSTGCGSGKECFGIETHGGTDRLAYGALKAFK